jgi:hypothetical protein
VVEIWLPTFLQGGVGSKPRVYLKMENAAPVGLPLWAYDNKKGGKVNQTQFQLAYGKGAYIVVCNNVLEVLDFNKEQLSNVQFISNTEDTPYGLFTSGGERAIFRMNTT